MNQPLSGIPGARSAIIHRTVRCATGLSGEPAEQRLSTCQRMSAAMNSACQKSKRRSQRALDCPVQLEDKRIQRSTAPNPNGCADMACTGQCTVAVRWRTGLSGAPITSSLCQWLGSGWGAINTPQPRHSLAPKYSKHLTYCKSKRLHS
jgi:hypothetical protein